MKQSKLFHLLFPFIMMVIPWIYLAFIWNDLPQIIPTHFGIDGLPDTYGPKKSILLMPVIFSVIGIPVYFIMFNIHKIDPKKKYIASTASVFSKIAVVVIILFCAMCMFIFYWTLKGKVEGIPVLFCGLSLFFAYIGNLMHSIKPNYFAGFRLPWALENEDNWRKTHQLASKIWFIGGIALAVISLILQMKALIVVFISAILIMSIVPCIYSFNLFRRSKNDMSRNKI
jgi:uncharacterized membrane protein